MKLSLQAENELAVSAVQQLTTLQLFRILNLVACLSGGKGKVVISNAAILLLGSNVAYICVM